MRLPALRLLCLLAAVPLLAACGTSARPVRAADVAAAVAPVADLGPVSSRTIHALAVLHRWDGRRAAAYAAGDVGLLRRLYVRGSMAGARDVRTLREYAARELVVDGLTVQVLSARVLEESPDRIRVHVVERFAGGAAVSGRSEVALPVGGPTSRTVTLVRTGERWLVRAVRHGEVSPRPISAARR